MARSVVNDIIIQDPTPEVSYLRIQLMDHSISYVILFNPVIYMVLLLKQYV